MLNRRDSKSSLWCMAQYRLIVWILWVAICIVSLLAVPHFSSAIHDVVTELYPMANLKLVAVVNSANHVMQELGSIGEDFWSMASEAKGGRRGAIWRKNFGNGIACHDNRLIGSHFLELAQQHFVLNVAHIFGITPEFFAAPRILRLDDDICSNGLPNIFGIYVAGEGGGEGRIFWSELNWLDGFYRYPSSLINPKRIDALLNGVLRCIGRFLLAR